MCSLLYFILVNNIKSIIENYYIIEIVLIVGIPG